VAKFIAARLDKFLWFSLGFLLRHKKGKAVNPKQCCAPKVGIRIKKEKESLSGLIIKTERRKLTRYKLNAATCKF
jgi:hypothetical protein